MGIILFVEDKIGIGTLEPESKLDIEGSVRIGSNYSGNSLITTDPTNGIIIEGKTGIGTSDPKSNLHVLSTKASHILYPFQIQNNALVSNSSNEGTGVGIRMELSNTGNSDVWSGIGAVVDQNAGGNYNTIESTALTFLTNKESNAPTEKMRLDARGRLGVGTTNPSSLVHFKGNDDIYGTTIDLNRYDGTALHIINSVQPTVYNHPLVKIDNSFNGTNSSADALEIVGNTTMSGTLDVSNNLNINNKLVVNSSTGYTNVNGNLDVKGAFKVKSSNGVQEFLISPSADLTTMSTDFDIIGDVDITGTTYLKGDLIGNSNVNITLNTNKFNVSGMTGNTTVGGTLNVTNATTLNSTLGFSSGTTINEISTDIYLGGSTLASDDKLATQKAIRTFVDQQIANNTYNAGSNLSLSNNIFSLNNSLSGISSITGSSTVGLNLYNDAGSANGLEISSSGYASATLRFGIGNDSPSKLLHIGKNGGNSGTLRFEASDGDVIDIKINTSDQLEVNGGDLNVNGGDLNLDDDGRVGFENNTSSTTSSTFYRTEFVQGTIDCNANTSGCSNSTDVIFYDDYIAIYLNWTEQAFTTNQFVRPGFKTMNSLYDGNWKIRLIDGSGGDGFGSADLEDTESYSLDNNSITYTITDWTNTNDKQFYIEDESDGRGYRSFWLNKGSCPGFYRVTYFVTGDMQDTNTGLTWNAIVEAWYDQ